MNQDLAAEFLTEFEKRLGDYDALNVSGQRLLTDLLEMGGLKVLSITGRVKDKESLGEKLVRPGKDYQNLQQVTDVVGLRVVTFFEDEVDDVASIIAREFQLVPEHCSDKRYFEDPDKFGYRSLHYVCKLSEARKNLSENARYREEMFEVQIRSILQHAWAEIEHDLGYKNPGTIPNEIRHQLFRVAGLLEIADIEFKEVRDRTKAYKEKVASDIRKNVLGSIQLNSISYLEFIDASQIVRDLDRSILDLGYTISGTSDEDFMIGCLKWVGIDTIEKLQTSLEQHASLLRSYAKAILTDPSQGFVNPALPVFHLAQIVALETSGVDGLAKFYEEHGIRGLESPQASALDTADTIANIEGNA
jgi:ppGpp synthetase/RelA/SpoT-type nucleotidyltranferase